VLTGGEHRSLHWSGVARVLIGMPVSVLGGGLLALIFYTAVRRLLGGLPHASLLRVARLQFAAAAIQAFGYGANDMEKTVGLLVAARSLTHLELPFPASDEVAAGAAFLLFAVGAVVGGARVMRRMGFGVLRVRPMQALAQQVATGAVVSVAAVAGAPVSMTQTIDGGLVGVGAADRASSIRWGVVRDMLASWVVTLPVALVAAALLHVVARIVGLA
jgi:PiT family inorganic phosphate transporter